VRACFSTRWPRAARGACTARPARAQWCGSADPAQRPRLETILASLPDRLGEAHEQGWRGEIAGLEVSIAAAEQKLSAMTQLAGRHHVTHLEMPDFRPHAGRSSPGGP